ncbi:uncharacterized protein YlbG (UPF0298 family) [Dysgonomonas hofstadii]|uniref:Uncharacterized protein YlbG (UPF0298 family) n=1 Tax=Dysgonomonas hofstadii TaxID=637886 RepID=A0A840CNL7_9BACT|nr:hypothetical protein [Dysgonomonas hofstadii]MBB4034585.1 uncharacterized protein YlbG (UPF0298 family) [Dysgonomonas hofstadii]
MKRFIILLIVICNLLLFVNCKGNDTPLAGKTQYIVFANNYFWEDADNNAIMITDSLEIDRLEKLLVGNELKELCKCGYDYQIQFFNEKNELLYSRILNTETDTYEKYNEDIKTIMRGLTGRIRDTPTHYVYNLQIDVHMPSDSIIKFLKEGGLYAFMLGFQEEQYPKLKLTYCEHYTDDENLDGSEERFKEIEEKIKFYVQPVETSFIHRTTTNETKYVDFKTNKISRLYYFPAKTNMDSLISQVNTLGVDYLFAESCSPYYYVQLLSNNNNIEEVSGLLKKYPFISRVSKATNGYVFEECSLTD